jgi:insulysin
MDSRPREVDAPKVEVTKPRNDKRGYRRVVLPNALECLLISDPDTDKVKLRRALFDQDGGRGFLW